MEENPQESLAPESEEAQIVAQVSGTEQDNGNKMLTILVGTLLVLIIFAGAAWYFLWQKPASQPQSQAIPESVQEKKDTDSTPVDEAADNTPASTDEATTSDETADTGSDENATSEPIDEQSYIMDDDQDELTNYEEKVLGTDPLKADTDGDGYNDLAEIKNGYNPNGAGNSDYFGETGICQAEYQKMIDTYGHSYADCYGDVSQANCEKTSKKNNIVLILDASGSMAARIAGKTKNEITREAAAGFIRNLDTANNLSIIMYGHKGSNQTAGKNESCNGIEEVYPLGTLDRDKAVGMSNTLKAVGYTPIAKSLEKAQGVLAAKKGESNVVILISDGEETCGGDTAAASQKLKAAGIKANVIGFDVGGNAEEQLKRIAENTGGAYYSARNLDELEQSLMNLTKMSCTQKENAWNDGLDSSLENAHNCFAKINDEAVSISVKTATEMHLGFCREFIDNKYAEREKSINDMIERASQQSLDAVDQLDPTYDNMKDLEE